MRERERNAEMTQKEMAELLGVTNKAVVKMGDKSGNAGYRNPS